MTGGVVGVIVHVPSLQRRSSESGSVRAIHRSGPALWYVRPAIVYVFGGLTNPLMFGFEYHTVYFDAQRGGAQALP